MTAPTLTEFLLARIDEDEAVARREGHYNPDEGGYYACPATRSEPYGDLGYGEDACDCGLSHRRARALADVAAKRRIVEDRVHLETVRPGAVRAHAEWVCRALATAYADHPDYHDEWRP